MTPEWISALWPIALAIGIAIWGLSRLAALKERVVKLEADRESMDGRLNEHGLRLAAGEVQITGMFRTLERIEVKLDRVIERRPL